MKESEKFKLTLESMLLIAYIDGECQEVEGRLIQNYLEKHDLDKHYEKKKDAYKKLSLKKIKEKLLSKSTRFEDKDSQYYLMCYLAEIVTSDRYVSPEENEILSRIEKNFEINFGFRIAKSFEFNPKQKQVIDAHYFDNLVVDAKAGSGKTEIIPERIMKLIQKDGVDKEFIWMISFSRSAVSEMRNRIMARMGRSPKNLLISTIDSAGFRINHSFGYLQEPLHGWSYGEHTYTYSVNLLLANLRIREPGLIDFLKNIQHVLIDEAQDIVASRRALLEEIIRNLNRECGVTILGDRAQAIYGWEVRTDKLFQDKDDERSLLELALENELAGRQWKKSAFELIYRTDNPEILEFVENSRKKILNTSLEPQNIYQDLKMELFDSEKFECKTGDETIRLLDGDSMAITHQNNMRMQFIHDLIKKKKGFRLKGSEYGEYYLSWIAFLFEDAAKNNKETFSIHDFKAFFFEKMDIYQKKRISFWSTWSVLLMYGQDPNTPHRLSIAELRKKLTISNRPIHEMASTTFGFSGTLIGTIHRLKGMEAENVYYKENHIDSRYRKIIRHSDLNREIFVAISRPKEKLCLIRDGAMTWNDWSKLKPKLKSRRWKSHRFAYDYLRQRYKDYSSFFMETGLKEDYCPYSIIMNQENLEKAKKTQEFLKKIASMKMNGLEKYKPKVYEEGFHEYHIKVSDPETEKEYYLGAFTSDVYLAVNDPWNGILQRILAESTRYEGKKLASVDNLRLMDIATFVLEDEPEQIIEEELFPCFKDMGAWLYPIIYGLGPWHIHKGKYNPSDDYRDRWMDS